MKVNTSVCLHSRCAVKWDFSLRSKRFCAVLFGSSGAKNYKTKMVMNNLTSKFKLKV